ncbi:MAG: S9 family peptidase [Rudaea sp.]|uniref:S9 family peptidase n=1 Tax=unclassified Rudaea TaxID=2627037 RepID=UPI0010F53E46|nr:MULTISPECIES: S9 family peptidase [unclassified Rudaea]MBN8884925.1 S9 family peptidase [Rudaea sp.]MBR0346318.1 S9 family peptidase [Rudaea sp.]
MNSFRHLCAFAALALAMHAHAARVATADDIVDLKQVEDAQISRDGTRIAYSVSTSQPEAKRARSRIHIVSATGKESARELPAPEQANDREPRWAGEHLLFLSDRPLPPGNDKTARWQVWETSVATGETKPLTRAATDVTHYALSANGKRLVYLASDAASPEAQAKIAAKDDAIEVERSTLFARAWVRDLAGGEATLVSPSGLQVHDATLSPDGATLALRVSNGTTLNDYWYDSRVVLVDPAKATIERTLCARASAFPLQFSPDGSRLLYGELGRYGMTATPYVHPLAGGERIALGSEWLGTLWLARWQNDATLIGEGQAGVRAAFLRIDATNGKATVLADAQAPFQNFSVAANGRIAFLGTTAQTPAEVWTLDGGKARQRTVTNPQVADWKLGTLRELEWRSSLDGRRITGLLVTPPGWQRGKPLPTLVQIHGGPAWAWASGWLCSWHDWAQLLAAHGYAVFLPNPRGSEGQGAAFAEAARNDWGGADFKDVLDGIDLLVREGVIDNERLAIGGWSYGGYLSAWAVTQSNRFKTAIVGAGVIDIGAMALTTDVPDYLPGYFGDPVRERAAYDAHSPIRHVANVRVPVLILHGDDDRRVPVAQGEMLFRALKRQGTPVEFVRYPRGPHWFAERAHRRDVLERVLAWLDAHLTASAPSK